MGTTESQAGKKPRAPSWLSERVDPLDFSPQLLRIRERPPAPLAGWLVRLLLALFGLMLVLAAVGQVDIVAIAEGKLVPETYLKIVQPAEQGVVREILVREGERVEAGQVLIRMDPVFANADARQLQADFHRRRLAVRRVDSQLADNAFARVPGDPPELHAELQAQHAANVHAYRNALAQEQALHEKAGHDLAAAREIKSKLDQVLPHYLAQEAAYVRLTREGFAGQLMLTDKQRERIEKEQDLRSQEHVIRSNLALIAQSDKRMEQITADYRRQLQAERVEHANQLERLRQDLAKISHRQGLLELRASQSGTVKDLATHTVGTVAAPGTILLTLVPLQDEVMAEVWVGNQDVGFVRHQQGVKLKLAAYPFQKYGLLQGQVARLSADASEMPAGASRPDQQGSRDRPGIPLAFRTLVHLETQSLQSGGQALALAAGMQVTAEINLGRRSVLEYLLSPLKAAFHEAGRER